MPGTAKNFSTYLILFATVIKLFGHGTEDELLPLYELEPLVIESSPLAPEISDLTQTWCVHEGKELDWIKAQTIGETLAFDAGVAQSFYGPNASRPIIRGLDGQRVRVLQNGLDTFDVSAASVDHAVAIDPMLIDRVEVLRGSSALLYGANAIGGVVNTIDRTIPSHRHGESVYGQAKWGHTGVNDGWNTGGVVFAEVDAFVFQVNGTFRETEDYDVPRFRLPDGTRTDSIANSDSETWTAGVGGSYLFDNGYVGVSYSHFDTLYGVPNEEAPTIDLERQRFELRGSFSPVSLDWVDTIEIQSAYGDYLHNEVESSGEIAATFDREGLESRIAALHSFGELEGVFGFQGNFDTMRVSGEENFFAGASGSNPEIAEENTQRLALFVMEDYALSSKWSLNGGVRLESFLRQFKGADNRDDFTASASAGTVHKLANGWSIGGNLNYTEREPETAELFSDGPHLSTGAFEVGDSTLEKESAYGIEAILRETEGAVTGEFSVFYTYFDDFIFLADTGRELDAEGQDPSISGGEALAERVYRGVSAEFYGLEAELEWSVFKESDWTVDLRGFGDVIRAKNISDQDDLPRTPPWRIGTGLNVQYRDFSLFMDVTHTGEQNRTAAGEDSTGSYTLLGVRAAYLWKTDYATSEFFVNVNNLTNDLARVHTSFLRDTAPLPGRSVDAGLNVRF
jgi:iron complex outermembrane recepter protein